MKHAFKLDELIEWHTAKAIFARLDARIYHQETVEYLKRLLPPKPVATDENIGSLDERKDQK